MANWDESADLVVVGSGGGSMCAGLVMRDLGKSALILEKTDKVGGSTSMSGGVLWVPNHPLQAEAGVQDSYDQGLAYLNATVGDAGPATSPARKDAFLRRGPEMVSYLRRKGLQFRRCEGWSDYYDEEPGGCPRSRSLAMELFDARELGEWNARLRRGPFDIPVRWPESRQAMLAKRTPEGFLGAVRLGLRMAGMKLSGKQLVGMGAAIQGRMLQAALREGVDIRLETPVRELIEENGRIVGVIAESDGKVRRIQARDGVLINAGGFARNAEMRRRYGPQPSSVDWTNANPGDTGEVLEMAMAHGAASDLMDQAVWLVTSVTPQGFRAFHVLDLAKPHLIMVDQSGERFTNESGSYMENGQRMYAHGAVPAWVIMESRHRERYPWAGAMGGKTPEAWFTQGYMKAAPTIEALAVSCGLNPPALRRTVDRFNDFARAGRDLDFKRGDRAYDRVFGDPSVKPNPCLGALEKGPFYAVRVFPGDVGTFGGLLTDEHARVLRSDGASIPGLWATGNSTASVMGRCYPGAGASIAASFIFGYVAAYDAAGQTLN
ncbi:MAG: FAD-dependent oxidoreductase [Caulobacterales bacterium]|nr:FAD-dependent oxidoreductase [Caulobacterales bacterium]